MTGEVERQGDIFDRGFATARATEETVAQLLDDQGAVIVVPSNTRHSLLERRTTWLSQEPAHAARTHLIRESPAEPRFTLQLLQQPRPISVKTAKRRDHDLPIKYRDTDGWVMIESAAGPDRVSGSRGTIPMSANISGGVTEDERWCGFPEGAVASEFGPGSEWSCRMVGLTRISLRGDAKQRRVFDYFVHHELMSEKTQIAVIGAGFSGVVTAAHLIRAGCSVTLINRSGRMALGSLTEPHAGTCSQRSGRGDVSRRFAADSRALESAE